MGKDQAKSTVRKQRKALTGGILERARNTVISGGNFTTVVGHTKAREDAFELLKSNVASSAFHDSAQHISPPRCHANTRSAVLQEIYNWIIQDTRRETWIAWLNGAAGAGKSAICQSIAEMCVSKGIIVASFFFFRTDPSRNTISPLVATLVYQLIVRIPEIKDLITHVIERDPLIFDTSFDTQVNRLIIQPLLYIQQSSPPLRACFIIDGLDECIGLDHQTTIIQTFTKFLLAPNSPLVVLFGSRCENHLKAGFRANALSRVLIQVPLDNNYLPDADIRIFLTDKFNEIRSTHALSHLLPDDWPSPAIMDEIIEKSSGQFIYAAVVINFLSLPHASPARQLQIIRGLRPSGKATPFAQLDALYHHIFSVIHERHDVNCILAHTILGKQTHVSTISRFLMMPKDDIHTALADLTSVITCEEKEIRFLHASLPDFLLDKNRSQEYHISPGEWGTRLSIRWFDFVESGNYRHVRNVPFCEFLKVANPTATLHAKIRAFDPFKTDMDSRSTIGKYLSTLETMDFADGGEAYRYQKSLLSYYVDQLYNNDLKRESHVGRPGRM